MHPLKKTFSIVQLTILLLVVVFVAVGYLFWQRQTAYQPTPVPVGFVPSIPEKTFTEPSYVPVTPEVSLANLHWVTYSNKSFGVTLSYPDNYLSVYAQGTENNVQRLVIGRIGGPNYIMEIDKINMNESLEMWWQNELTQETSGGGPPNQLIKSTTTFKNLPAYYLKGNAPAQMPMDFYAIKRNGYVLTIYFETEGTEALQAGPSPNAQSIQFYRDSVKAFQSYDKVIVNKILDSITLD